MACVCAAVNDVGEPCEGEPHARFDGGREVTRCRWPQAQRADNPPAYPTSPLRGQFSIGLDNRHLNRAHKRFDTAPWSTSTSHEQSTIDDHASGLFQQATKIGHG
jgi:hypothetical protein